MEKVDLHARISTHTHQSLTRAHERRAAVGTLWIHPRWALFSPPTSPRQLPQRARHSQHLVCNAYNSEDDSVRADDEVRNTSPKRRHRRRVCTDDARKRSPYRFLGGSRSRDTGCWVRPISRECIRCFSGNLLTCGWPIYS